MRESREDIMATVKPIPEGQHSITAGLIVKNARQAIEFYKTAFGARDVSIWTGPDGKSVMHAELKIGDTKIFLGEESTDMGTVSPQSLGGTGVSLNLFTEDCDATFKRAIGAGAKVKTPLADQFWGDRYGKLTDPFGHVWGIATHKEDVSREEMEKRMKQTFAAAAKK
jgi:PhnB protein